MGRTVTVVLECNTCGTRRQGKPGQSTSELRAALTTVGWRAIAAKDVDVCAGCVTKAQLQRGASGGHGPEASA